MRFLMQIFQGEALEAWARLSEEEQQGSPPVTPR